MSTTQRNHDEQFTSVSLQDNNKYKLSIRDNWDSDHVNIVYEKTDLVSLDAVRKEILRWTLGKVGGRPVADLRASRERFQIKRLA